MIRKTYEVTGLMDWTAQIKVGKGAVSVHFTGGALTAYGVTPATYSTTKPFFQHIIEHSDYFKSGRIRPGATMYVPDDATTIVAKQREAKQEEAKDAPTTATATPAEAEPAEQPAAEAKAEDKGELKQMQMTDLNAAKEYLADTYGILRNSLRSKKQILEAAAANGIELIFDE